MENHSYTISVYTEKNIGLLNRVSAIFLKRHINIESITASESEIEDVYRFVIVAEMTAPQVSKIATQIEKQVEVIKVFYHMDDETIFQESALFKIASKLLFDDYAIQKIIKKHNARMVTVSRDFFVIEKTGIREEITALYKELYPFGIMQFVRSGRISVSKTEMKISTLLKEFKS